MEGGEGMGGEGIRKEENRMGGEMKERGGKRKERREKRGHPNFYLD